MRVAAAVLVLISVSPAQTQRVPLVTQAPPKPIVAQSSAGACSPVIQDVGGNVSVTYQPGSCPGLDPAAVKRLNAFLAEFPRTQKNLNDLLTLRNTQIAEKAKEVEEWINKYRDLEERLRQDDSELSRRALAKLRDGDMDGARKDLDEILARDESRVDQAARNNFARGRAAELQFQPVDALPYYERAYRYRPDIVEYAFQYARLLQNQNRHSEAGAIYAKLLSSVRKEAEGDPARMPDVARILNNLGVIYGATQRMGEAEKVYSEALAAYRKLAATNPDMYLPDAARTLNNLGMIYSSTQRMGEAERVYSEALATYRKLAEANPDTYLPDAAITLNNLGVFYGSTQRMGEAEKVYSEALATYRKLAAANPDVYLGGVALALNNLGALYRDTRRMGEAEKVSSEALATYRKLAAANPDVYLPNVAMTLNNLGVIYDATQRMGEAEKVYSEALATYHKLAAANPDMYLPEAARTLNNLGVLYGSTQRMGEAEKVFSEALVTYRKLAAANPNVYLPSVAMTLNNLGMIYRSTQRMGEAEKVHSEALGILNEQFVLNPAAHASALMGSMLHLGLVKLRIPGGRSAACQLASEIRRAGVTQFPDWAKELPEACPAN